MTIARPLARAGLLACALTTCGDSTPTADAGAPRTLLAVMLERWTRVDPYDRHTIAAALSFRDDGRSPALRPADARCRYHDATLWTAENPSPNYGAFRLTAPALGTAEFTEASGYEPVPNALGWNTGDRLRLATTGGAVPPFALEDVVPAPVILTSHDLPGLRANALRIPRSAPLALRWEPADGEVFLLFLQFDVAATPRAGLWCFFPARDGAASVTTAALGHLIPTAQVRSTNLYFGAASRTRTTAGGVDVEMITWNAEAARVVVE